MASELKPCPFCGSNRIAFRSTPDMDTDGKFHCVSCNECGAKSRDKFAMDACPLFYEELCNAWNTRPSPAATDTGLETIEPIEGRKSFICNSRGERTYLIQLPEGEYVTRSQAEAIVAAKEQERNDSCKAWRDAFDSMHRRAMDSEADNAAKDARIKELEASRNEMDNIAYAAGFYQAECNLPEHKNAQEALKEYRYLKALEAKLAAAEKALDPFADHANDRAVDDTGWRDKETVKIVVSIGDLRRARAALEAKP